MPSALAKFAQVKFTQNILALQYPTVKVILHVDTDRLTGGQKLIPNLVVYICVWDNSYKYIVYGGDIGVRANTYHR